MSSSADFPAVDQLALPEDLQSRLQIAQEHGLVLPSGMVADTSYSGFIEYNRWVYPPRKWQRRDWTLRWNEYYPSGGGVLYGVVRDMGAVALLAAMWVGALILGAAIAGWALLSFVWIHPVAAWSVLGAGILIAGASWCYYVRRSWGPIRYGFTADEVALIEQRLFGDRPSGWRWARTPRAAMASPSRTYSLPTQLNDDVVARTRYACEWGSGDALHRELADEVERLRKLVGERTRDSASHQGDA